MSKIGMDDVEYQRLLEALGESLMRYHGLLREQGRN